MDGGITGAEPTAERLIATRAPTLAMDASGLSLDGVALGGIADAVGTPAWAYGADTMRARVGRLADALAMIGIGRGAIHYAVKANDHLAVLGVFASCGIGADVVSEGELLRALAAGIPAGRIVFSGVGKTDRELALAVSRGIARVNVESVEELRALAAIAHAQGRVQRVAIRVNPDVDAGTHDKISTGREGDKFGVPAGDAVAAARLAASLPGIAFAGLAFHIGSQIMDPGPIEDAAMRVARLVDAIRAAGVAVDEVDCGGGFGIGYGDEPDAEPDAIAACLGRALGGRGLALSVEPGRWLVARAGVLLASVVRRKAADRRPFLVLDAAMNDLARPALYDAWHGIVPLDAASLHGARAAHDVVGPVCESSDVLATGRMLPALAPGARVAVLDAGAYGAVMSSTYNARPFAPQVLVEGGAWTVIRARQPIDAMWRDEIVPPAPARRG